MKLYEINQLLLEVVSSLGTILIKYFEVFNSKNSTKNSRSTV
jgi:hypothetical protein